MFSKQMDVFINLMLTLIQDLGIMILINDQLEMKAKIGPKTYPR